MGGWAIKNSEGDLIYTASMDNKELQYTFPTNKDASSPTDKVYTIEYQDASGCSGSTTMTVPYCEVEKTILDLYVSHDSCVGLSHEETQEMDFTVTLQNQAGSGYVLKNNITFTFSSDFVAGSNLILDTDTECLKGANFTEQTPGSARFTKVYTVTFSSGLYSATTDKRITVSARNDFGLMTSNNGFCQCYWSLCINGAYNGQFNGKQVSSGDQIALNDEMDVIIHNV